MKAAPHIDYKALYQQSVTIVKEQATVISLLRGDVTKCVKEQQRLGQVVDLMHKTLINKEELIVRQQHLIASYEQTIHNFALKISQQESVIVS